MRSEALTKGISQATLDQAFSSLQPDPVIIARDRTQPELTQSLDDYVTARLNPKTLARAAEVAKAEKDVIERVHATYGIPGPIMVAIWGLESNFGQFTGVRPVITALATLAYDGRRPALFRAELFQALAIVDRGLVNLPEFIGSWAGAIGQPQFMPSSFLKYAVDFDGDGKIDIWTSSADVLGSMANYLKTAGWTEGARWGREVKISPTVMAKIEKTVPMRSTGCRARREMTEARPVSDWRTLGVLEMNGAQAARRVALRLARARPEAQLPRLSELPGDPRIQLLERLRGERRVDRGQDGGRGCDQVVQRQYPDRARPRAAGAACRPIESEKIRSPRT